MGLVATEPLRIGDRIVQPGEELKGDDLKGRNIGMMKRHGQLVYEPNKTRRPRRDESDGE